MEILESFDISARLKELLHLKDGWYDGKEGKALNKNQVTRFQKYFENHFNADLKLPAIFPTTNGDIVLEWKKANIEISMEVDLNTLNAEILIFDMDNDEYDKQLHVNLNNASDWNEINTIL